jgi:hypothetical protein
MRSFLSWTLIIALHLAAARVEAAFAALFQAFIPIHEYRAASGALPQAGLRLPLSPTGGTLDLAQACPGGHLGLRYRSPDEDGQRYEACLEREEGNWSCVALPPSHGAWVDLRLALPGVQGERGFPGPPALRQPVRALWIRPLKAGTSPRLSLDAEEPRLDVGAPGPAPETVAAALDVDAIAVTAARALDLPESLVWVLARLQRACACPAADLLKERQERSWGEIAAARGLDWAGLNLELHARARAAGLTAPEPTPRQLERAWSSQASGAQP